MPERDDSINNPPQPLDEEPVLIGTAPPVYELPPEQIKAIPSPPRSVTKNKDSLRSSAKWFYWIAGLSLLNSIINLYNGDFTFVIGLGITQIFDAGTRYGGLVQMITLAINLIISGTYLAIGYYASRWVSWVFLTGIILYSLDTLIVLGVHDFPLILFHCIALFALVRGYREDG